MRYKQTNNNTIYIYIEYNIYIYIYIYIYLRIYQVLCKSRRVVRKALADAGLHERVRQKRFQSRRARDAGADGDAGVDEGPTTDADASQRVLEAVVVEQLALPEEKAKRVRVLLPRGALKGAAPLTLHRWGVPRHHPLLLLRCLVKSPRLGP